LRELRGRKFLHGGTRFKAQVPANERASEPGVVSAFRYLQRAGLSSFAGPAQAGRFDWNQSAAATLEELEMSAK
jgi:hypothetical protein